VGDPAGTRDAADLDTYILTNNAALDRYLQYGRHGCKISYASASTITVGAGSIVCSNSDASTRHLRANTSATTVTWANIDTGAEAISTTYYLWAIADADATTFTVMVSLSNTAPTGATYYALLGAFYNDSSGNITNIVDYGSYDTVGTYDSGWFAVSVNGTYTKTHSLGTTKVLPVVYISANSDGSGNCAQVAAFNVSDGQGHYYGTNIYSLTTTTVSVTCAPNGLLTALISGVGWYPTSGYCRIILISLDN